jgi:hypothetical protein
MNKQTELTSKQEDIMLEEAREKDFEIRAKEFIECLGNGKTIYQIEAEEDREISDEEDMKADLIRRYGNE